MYNLFVFATPLSSRLPLCLGAIGYYETSALTRTGVSEAVTAALRAVISAQSSQSSRRKFTWPWKRCVYVNHFRRDTVVSSPGPLLTRFSACNIEKLGVAWVRG